MQLPDVFAYLDYRAFLADWFAAKKAENRHFSHRAFAKRAKQRSPSLLKHVIDGDRDLTPATTEAFAKALGLDAARARFFRHLVHLDQADTAQERDEALAAIVATRKFREARRVEGDALHVFDHWYHPAICELASRDDFEADPAWIARTLRPRITPAAARKALDLLLRLGLLAENNGQVRPADAQLVTPHEVADVAANRYHLDMLERARDAVMDVGRDERHVLGVTVCIPKALVPELKERLNAFQEELLSLCDQAPREQVFQLELALFPLSDGRRSEP